MEASGMETTLRRSSRWGGWLKDGELDGQTVCIKENPEPIPAGEQEGQDKGRESTIITIQCLLKTQVEKRSAHSLSHTLTFLTWLTQAWESGM